MKVSRFFSVVACAMVLTGCAVPKSQYYSLLPEPHAVNKPVAATEKTAKFAISVQPVELPDQVNRPQIVLSQPNSTEVLILNGSLWAAPLQNEIRNALADDLSRQLGVLDLPLGDAPGSLPIWRIDFTVQRFDSVYNQHVMLEATWRLEPRRQPDKNVRICRAAVRVAVEPGMQTLVAGHQQALHRLASVIAAQLQGVSPSVESVVIKGCT
ncbi:MAG TPA: PqiC family protein [Eoetvoesiella sp.]